MSECLWCGKRFPCFEVYLEYYAGGAASPACSKACWNLRLTKLHLAGAVRLPAWAKHIRGWPEDE